ncbi:MAG: hypothetical protein ACJ74A_04570 [Gaiellaceae bacterium]
MPRGYEDGPVAEAAQARRDMLDRGEPLDSERRGVDRRAVYGSTPDQPEKHFLGWADQVNADELFASGDAWGISVLRHPG